MKMKLTQILSSLPGVCFSLRFSCFVCSPSALKTSENLFRSILVLAPVTEAFSSSETLLSRPKQRRLTITVGISFKRNHKTYRIYF